MSDQKASEKDKKPQPQPLSRQTKILTTAAILLGNVSFGCSLNTFSPILDEIRSKYETTIEDISVIFTVVTTMHCCGAIICGFISNYINRQLVVIAGLAIMVVAIFMTPYCDDKITFFVCGGMLGFSSGLYDSSQMVWVIELWQSDSGPFIQVQHLFYGIGAVIAPVIVAPFLSKQEHSKVDVTDSTIHIPFLIVGAFGAFALLFQLFLFTFYRYHTPPMYANENFELIDDAKNVPSAIDAELNGGNVSINQQKDHQNQLKENATIMGVSIRKVKLVAITIAFLGAYQSMEVSTMQFLPTFGRYSDRKMTESACAYVLTGLMAMFAVGRLIGAVNIFKVRPELIILINFIFVAIGNTILMIWANSSLPMFWLGSMILGMGYSTIFPSFCVFIEKYLVFTTAVASSTLVFGSFVSSIYSIIIGKFIEHHPLVLTYTNLISTTASIAAMIWGYKITRKSVDRER